MGHAWLHRGYRGLKPGRVSWAALAGVLALAGGCDSSEQGRSLHFTAVSDSHRFFGQGGGLPRGGTEGFSRLRLVDDSGRHVGFGYQSCVLTGTEPLPLEEVCSFVFKLEGGQVSASGVRNVDLEGEAQQYAITGGTGDYENAGGTMTFGATTSGSWDVRLELSD